MKRPLLIVAIAYTIGIIIGVYLKTSISFAFVMFLFLLLVTILLKNKNDDKFREENSFVKLIKNKNITELIKDNNITIFFYSKNIAKISIIILVSFLISYTRVTYMNNKYEKIYSLDEKNIHIIGTICDEIKETDYKNTVTVRVDKGYKNIKLILYFDKKVDLKKLEYGNQISVTGIYNAPVGSRNYKGYSYRRYLQTKGVYGTVEADKSLTVIKTKNLNIVIRLINKLSCKFKTNFDILFNERVAGLASGILLGNNSKIPNDIKENFAECNLTHMLAVSGSHLVYLILGINTVLNKKIFGIRGQKIICIVLIIIFMIIVNMTPSVVRAGISSIIAIISTMIYRKQDTYTTISIALLITLISNPFSLFNMGLQLSYLATLSIVIFYPRMRKTNNKKRKIQKYILDSINLTLSANILILPLLIYNFNKIPVNSVLSNLLTGPILAGCTILGFFTLVISLVCLPVAKVFAIPLNLLFNLLIMLTNTISKIPFGNYTVVTPYLVTIILCYIIIFLYLKNKKKIVKLIIILTAIIIVANQLLGFIILHKQLKIYFIDVGQGDSCLICTPRGKNILIDGGGNRDLSKYDVGEKVLLPYLLDRRTKTLDYVVISHFDADHVRTDFLL